MAQYFVWRVNQTEAEHVGLLCKIIFWVGLWKIILMLFTNHTQTLITTFSSGVVKALVKVLISIS